MAETDDQDRNDMARLVTGQDAALDDLMGRHAEKLFRYLLRLLQNETEAGDLAQEAFVRVYQKRDSYRPANKFSAWLFAIATNLARDLRRHHSRHPQVSLEAPRDELGNDFRETIPDAKPDPGSKLELAERAETVRCAVAALPEDLRIPLILAEYEEKSQAEIAEILGCSAKAVEMRIYRARQSLRSKLTVLLEPN